MDKTKSELLDQLKNLEESRQLYEAVFHSMPDAAAVLDSEGVIFATNRAWQRFALENGYLDDNLGVGQNYLAVCDVATGDDAPAAFAVARGIRAVMSGHKQSFELEYPCHSPFEQRWFRVRVSPMVGLPTHSVLVTHVNITGLVDEDVLPQPPAEIARRRTQEPWQTILNKMPVLIVAWDEDFNVIVWNRECELVTGYSSAEIVGNPRAVELLWPDPQQRTEILAELKARRGHFRDLEIPVVNKRNEKRMVSWSSVAKEFPISGWATWDVGLDVTDRKWTEAVLDEERDLLALRVAEQTAELRQTNAELLRAGRLKNEFLAGMSHELRTPLSAILGMAEVIKSGAYGSINNDITRAIGIIDESGKHLLSLINDVLDLSKIEANKMELEISAVPVESLCDSTLHFVRQNAHKKEIDLTLTIDPEARLIQADARRLKQILVNLLSNAVKFTPARGKIDLTVTADAERQALHFAVSDTGVGIAAQDMPKLFQPFEQINSRLAREQGGTGLGLSLVYKLTEMHGGSVSVESQVGQGSTFVVSLPWQVETSPKNAAARRLAGQQAADKKPEPQDPAAGPLVLIVEDNEAAIQVFSDYLEIRGFRIALARNGFEALTQTKALKPNVILMDIQMPELDGLQTIKELRSGVFSELPIIALTALAMPGDRERCLRAGASEYLSKPVHLKDLSRVIDKVLAEKNG